ncbi:hypothetical protein VE03_06803 [Pseudogymnoascus sp. 23342-1-I1]|nr:hypothetical protein VE03_06803 [Pseudogymnoascus sp. 23342-1-I1]
MQSFRRRRYQYVWAGIGRAYYRRLSRRQLGNSSRNAGDVDPTTSPPRTESSAQVDQNNAKPPWRDLNRTTQLPIGLNQRIGKGPWQDLNRTPSLPLQGQPREYSSSQLDSTPQKPGEGSTVRVNTQGKRESSASHRATQASRSTKLSTEDNPAEVPTVTWEAVRRTCPSKQLRRSQRALRFGKINKDIKLEQFLPGYDTQDGLGIGSSASGLTSQETHLDPITRDTSPSKPSQSMISSPSSQHEDDSPQTPDMEQFGALINERSETLADVVAREDGLQIGHDVPNSDGEKADAHPTIGDMSQLTQGQHITTAASATPAVPESPMLSASGPITVTREVHESDRERFAQQDSDYGPAFAPYTTKLLERNEGWKSRPALWDISPGCLLWLPLYYNNFGDTELLHPNPESLDHAIVVLSVNVSGPEDAIVTFMQLRTFKSLGPRTSLLKFWKRHLPISRFPRESWKDEPMARESWKDALLFLEHYPRKTLSKLTYVDIQDINTARWEDLRCYLGKRRVENTPPRLGEESMAQLRAARTWWEGHFRTGRGLVRWEDEWVPTGEMREAFRRRYIEPLGKKDNELGSVVAGKIPDEASERDDASVLKMEVLRAEVRAEFEDAREKMREELDRMRAETRAELMAGMLAEFEDVKEGLQMVNRAEKAVVELKVAKSARPPIPQPEYATSSQLAIWQAANDMPEENHDLTRKVEGLRVELKLARIEMDVMRAEMEGMRDEVEGLRDDVDKMKVGLELVKRAARRQKSKKMPDVGMYAPALGPRSSAARAASYVSEGTAEATIKGLKEELEQAMGDPAQAAQAAQEPAPVVSSLLQRTRSGPRLGPLAQSRG